MRQEEKDKLHKAADKYAKRFSPWLYSCIMEAFIDGAEWQKKQTIDKACDWLKENKDHPLIGCEDPCLSGYLTDEFIKNFKKAMEE